MVGENTGFLGFKKKSVDICMIDGDHNSYAAYDDAIHCHELLKPGGWMIFDDVRNRTKKKDHVDSGVKLFLQTLQRGGGWMDKIYEGTHLDIYQKASLDEVSQSKSNHAAAE
jgi:predicted O-methyltransferase YrrM